MIELTIQQAWLLDSLMEKGLDYMLSLDDKRLPFTPEALLDAGYNGYIVREKQSLKSPTLTMDQSIEVANIVNHFDSTYECLTFVRKNPDKFEQFTERELFNIFNKGYYVDMKL